MKKHKKHDKAKELAKGKKLKKFRHIADKLVKQSEKNDKLKGYDMNTGWLDGI